MFGDGRDWHGRSLARAFKRRGINPLLAPLNQCGFSTETATGLAIPGLGNRLPEGAFVRFVPGGSFEEVTLYLGVLHALRELGVTVWNDARAIERCVDKSTTTFFLQRAGIPTPRTFARVGRAEAEAITTAILAEGHKLVQKPLFGAQGKGLRLISSVADLASPEEVNGVYYLQEFIPPAQKHHQDWRLFVCQGRVIAAMIRHGSSWITNIKQGARAKAAIASQDLIDLAVRAAGCVGADYAGVDIIQARDGRFLVLEVNSMPAWNGLQRVSPRAHLGSPGRCLSRRGAAAGAPRRPRGRLTRSLKPEAIARSFLDACLAELDALKPGNVHRFGDGHGMTTADFVASAEAAAPVMGRQDLAVGERIRLAVEATQRAVAQNTNLGIILLAAPLANAALDPRRGNLEKRLHRVLAALSVDDARNAYQAIRAAKPGGLAKRASS